MASASSSPAASSGLKSGPDGVVLLKPWEFVKQELGVLAAQGPKQMLEVGVYEGGGAVLWSRLLPLTRYVGLDHRDLATLHFPKAVEGVPRWASVQLVGGVSQDDPHGVERAMSLFDGPFDVVIDDASHQYGLSTATFELCFPRMAADGMYLIEDWNWAHSPGPWDSPTHPWHAAPSLANLVVRLVLLAAEHRDVVSRVDVRPNFAVVWRGPRALPARWRLDDALSRRALRELF